MGAISNPHKATIKRHLEESLAEGVPLDQIHKELVETFSRKGKYSLQQITAVTSWLRSSLLQERRVQASDLNEEEEGEDSEEDQTNEDIDFNLPVKVTSREWHFERIAHTFTEEQRQIIKLLLMPGRNPFDIEAAKENGFRSENLVTYIKGSSPAANAEYIRIARKYGVLDRRICDLEKGLPNETEILNAAYLDFFGMFCPAYHRILQMLPVDPSGKIAVGINIMEGREHSQTKEALRAFQAIKRESIDLAGIIDAKDERQRKQEIVEREKANPSIHIRETRDDILRLTLFSGVGVANTKQWMLPEELKKFAQSGGEHGNWDDLTPTEQFEIIHQKMDMALAVLSSSGPQFRRQGIPCDLVHLGFGTRIAAVNSPQIHKIEGPNRYISPNGNRPFASYFAQLETHQNHYKQFERAMTFFLRIGSEILTQAKRVLPLGNFAVTGTGNARVLQFFSADKKLIDSLKIETLIHSEYGLTQIGIAQSATGFTDQEWKTMKTKVVSAVMQRNEKEEAENIPKTTLPSILRPLGLGQNQRIGRNDPCPCGSGSKFKKCCMKH